MSTIQITLSDTPTGGVAAHLDFRPAVGSACSPAQSAALDIVRQLRSQWRGQEAPHRLYLCGPMTSLPDLNKPAFNAAAKQLREAGYIVVTPTENGLPASATWEDHLRADLADMVTFCNAVAFLEGSENSRGAQLEIDTAACLGLPVAHIDHWLNRALKNKQPKAA